MLLKACVRGSHGQKSFLTNKAPLEIQGIKRFFAKFSFLCLLRACLFYARAMLSIGKMTFTITIFLKEMKNKIHIAK